jgi:hypothetical protein
MGKRGTACRAARRRDADRDGRTRLRTAAVGAASGGARGSGSRAGECERAAAVRTAGRRTGPCSARARRSGTPSGVGRQAASGKRPRPCGAQAARLGATSQSSPTERARSEPRIVRDARPTIVRGARPRIVRDARARIVRDARGGGAHRRPADRRAASHRRAARPFGRTDSSAPGSAANARRRKQPLPAAGRRDRSAATAPKPSVPGERRVHARSSSLVLVAGRQRNATYPPSIRPARGSHRLEWRGRSRAAAWRGGSPPGAPPTTRPAPRPCALPRCR